LRVSTVNWSNYMIYRIRINNGIGSLQDITFEEFNTFAIELKSCSSRNHSLFCLQIQMIGIHTCLLFNWQLFIRYSQEGTRMYLPNRLSGNIDRCTMSNNKTCSFPGLFHLACSERMAIFQVCLMCVDLFFLDFRIL